MLVKVKEHNDLVRDMSTNAILNVNNGALDAYKKRKANLNKVDRLEEKVLSLESKMDQILDLLKQTINNK
jgi:hypothetical protein